MTRAQSFISGNATGTLLHCNAPLSFWGGVDLDHGTILDTTHPLCGQSIKGRILAVPCGRGSCSGSAAIMELLYNGSGPSALIFETPDPILMLGVLIARKIWGFSIPVIVVSGADFLRLSDFSSVHITDSSLLMGRREELDTSIALHDSQNSTALKLDPEDRAMLNGSRGVGKQFAMEVVSEFARLQGADQLTTISSAHIDACIYTGPGILSFAQTLARYDSDFAVPTTLNALSVDRIRWRDLNMNEDSVRNAQALADAYLSMRARPSFTCAPYSLAPIPQRGEQIGWSESNAVIYANSVLGARTQKYPDCLDVCLALTGRAPYTGAHSDNGRKPSMRIHVQDFENGDTVNWALLGYLTGNLAGHEIPLLTGTGHHSPSTSDLKNLCAAFGTTSSASMLHIEGVTPDLITGGLPLGLPVSSVTQKDLLTVKQALTTACDSSVQLIALGNPHFLLEEFKMLADLCRSKQKNVNVDFVITTNRDIESEVAKMGLLATLVQFGACIITDTCWCMIQEPVIRPSVKNIMTNSAKFAHYGPSLVKKGMHLGSLSECVVAACTGHVDIDEHCTYINS